MSYNGQAPTRHTDAATNTHVRSIRRALGIGIGIGVLAAPMLAGTAAFAGQTLVVDDDGAQCSDASFSTITDALEVAADGDLINVCPGVYREELRVAKPVSIVGPADAVGRLDCFAPILGDLDTTQVAVLEPPHESGTESVNPAATLDADGIELAGLVIQGVRDTTPARDETNTYNLYIPAVSSTDSHSGYRIHHNLIRSNTLGVEFGSSGASPSQFDHNCIRENRWGLSNQRWRLDEAVLEANVSFRTQVIAYEIGWGYREAHALTLRENESREDGGYAIRIENASETNVSSNRISSVAIRGIEVAAGNTDVEVHDNLLHGPTASVTGSGIGLLGPAVGSTLTRSTGVVVRDNTVSGFQTTTGAVGGHGILAAAGAAEGAMITDNVTFGNGASGITLFNNNRNNVVRDNVSYDNGTYGIRVQATGSTGNLIQDNRTFDNGVADASDATDPNPADGIQLLNTWVDNNCSTDQPVGAICD